MRDYEEIIMVYVKTRGLSKLKHEDIKVLEERYNSDDRLSYETKEKISSQIKLHNRRYKKKLQVYKERLQELSQLHFGKPLNETIHYNNGYLNGFLVEDNQVKAYGRIGDDRDVRNAQVDVVDKNE